MTVQVGSWRRSFFLASIAVRNSPCNFKRNVDRSAEKREQQYDLFKRHGASPLSALKRPGERDFKKNLFTRRAQVPVRRKAATATTAACGRSREKLLGPRPARRKCRPRHAADAGSRNSYCVYNVILFIKTQQGFAVAFIAAKPCFYFFFFGNTNGSCRYTATRYAVMKHQMMGSHRMTAL